MAILKIGERLVAALGVVIVALQGNQHQHLANTEKLPSIYH